MKYVFYFSFLTSLFLQNLLLADRTDTQATSFTQQRPIGGTRVEPMFSPGSATPQSQEAMEYTLSIIKPDGVKNKHIGEVISRFEKEGLRIAALKMVTLNKEQASQFYQAHHQRSFYGDLVNFMSSGPIVVMVIEGKNAISKNRQLMGATDPSKAEKGTIRADLAESLTKNTVHGSDSPEAARNEISFFFKPYEIYLNPSTNK